MSHWMRRSLLIARVRSLRSVREMQSRPLLAALNLLPLLLIAPAVVGRLPISGYESVWAEPGAYVYGVRFDNGEHVAILDVARTSAVVLFTLVAYLVTLPELSSGGMLGDETEDLLVVVDPRTIVLAEQLTYVGFTARLAGIIVLSAAIAFGFGAGSPLATALIVLAAATVFLTAIAVTYPIVLAVKLAFAVVDPIRNNKLLVGGPLVVVLFGLYLAVDDIAAAAASVPLSWYGDLAFVALTPTASAVRALSALLAALILVVLSVPTATLVADRLWHVDVEPSSDESSAVWASSRVGRLACRYTSRPVGTVAVVTWRRLRRNPKILLYGGLLVALTASVGIATAERYPNAVPIMVAIYSAASVSVGVTLNPLGNEGTMLPLTLTAPGGGRSMVGGYALSGAVPGAVLVAVATLLSGVYSPLNTSELVGITALGAILGATAPLISLGIGVALPQFDGISAARSSQMYPPRLKAVVSELFVVVGIGLPSVVGLHGSEGLVQTTAIPARVITAAGVGTTLVACIIVGWLSLCYAISAIERYEP